MNAKMKPTPTLPRMRVNKWLHITDGYTECSTEQPDCGFLHDNMSLEWAKFKDLVDGLQSNGQELGQAHRTQGQLNQQLESIRNTLERPSWSSTTPT